MCFRVWYLPPVPPSITLQASLYSFPNALGLHASRCKTSHLHWSQHLRWLLYPSKCQADRTVEFSQISSFVVAAGRRGSIRHVDDGVAAEVLLSDYGEQGHTRPTSPAAHAAMLQFVAGAITSLPSSPSPTWRQCQNMYTCPHAHAYICGYACVERACSLHVISIRPSAMSIQDAGGISGSIRLGKHFQGETLIPAIALKLRSAIGVDRKTAPRRPDTLHCCCKLPCLPQGFGLLLRLSHCLPCHPDTISIFRAIPDFLMIFKFCDTTLACCLQRMAAFARLLRCRQRRCMSG